MRDYNRRDDLAAKLFKASDLQQRNHQISRFERVITHPVKTCYPRFLESVNLGHRLTTKTFWGGNIEVVLPEKVSTHIWRYGFFEKDVSLFLLGYLQEEMSYLDIGAHFGFFTMLGSHLVGETGRVLAFEPTPTTYQQLLRNVGERTNVETYNYAILDSDSEVIIKDYGLTYCAWNSLSQPRGKTGRLKTKNHITVQAKHIDGFIGKDSDIHLVKIDAESTEMSVLRGMARTLETQRPILIIEVGDFESDDEPTSRRIVNWLQAVGYSPYELNNGNVMKHKPKEHYDYGNLLFIAE